MTIPFVMMGRLASEELAQRPPITVELPVAQFGLELALAVVLERVRFTSAPEDRIGVVTVIALKEGQNRVATFEMDVTVPAAFARGESGGAIEIALMPADLGAIRPKSTPEGRAILGAWLTRKLPPMARRLLTDAVVEALVDEVLGLFAREVWPRIKGDVLGRSPLVETRLGLPDVNLRDVRVSSRADALVVSMTTGFGDAIALRPGEDPVTSGRMVLKMSGGSLAGLVNRAIALGLVPGRFSASGTTEVGGPWEMRLGWVDGARPLRLHLWKREGECRRAEIGADVSVALRGDTVAVRAHEGRYVDVEGPAFAGMLAWLDNTFGRALSTSLEVTSLWTFEKWEARLTRIRLERDFLFEFEPVLKSR